jgi:hypothetical protein
MLHLTREVNSPRAAVIRHRISARPGPADRGPAPARHAVVTLRSPCAPPPETPLILVGRDGRRRVVLAADVAAQSAGLRAGMPASKAQALVQGLVIQDADPKADSEALERLAFWMLQRFAPIVAADPPNGIVIDSTGADHLHGGEAATLAILVDKLAGVGLRARASIADTWGAAHALARFDARSGFAPHPLAWIYRVPALRSFERRIRPLSGEFPHSVDNLFASDRLREKQGIRG